MTTAETAQPGRITFEPALEGLRGFALLGMLCIHSGFSWAGGAFFTISTFFTLSGFLITSLFLAEWQKHGRISLGQFWTRRFRRLMPAALLTLAAMTLFGALVADADQLERLPRDVFAALFYVANWHFLFSNVTYAQLFSAPSPVQHFWSLAIEEQFYLAYPLVAVVALRLGSGSRRVFAGVLMALVAASVITSAVLTGGGAPTDRIYYGSDTRAAELLLGGVAALALSARKIESAKVRSMVEWVGVVALIAMVGVWATVPLDAAWVYYGGFAAYTLLSLLVIAAAVQPQGLVRALLSGGVMRWIGRVSYGAYLFHWPVFLWLNEERTQLGALPLFILRFVVTFGVADLSYRFFESPIRSGRVLTGWRAFAVVPAAFAGVVFATSVLTPSFARTTSRTASATRGAAAPAPNANVPSANVAVADKRSSSKPDEYDPTEDARQLNEYVKNISSGKLKPSRADDGVDVKAPPSFTRDKPRVAFYGDSTALFLGLGFQYYMKINELARDRSGIAEPGCGLVQVGKYRCRGREINRPNHCTKRDLEWKKTLKSSRTDVAIAFAGPWDVCDRQLPGDDQWRAPGDPRLDAQIRKELLSATDILLSDGGLVLWLTHPDIEQRDLGGKRPAKPYPESNPQRMDRLNQLIFELEKLRPGRLKVVDLAKYMATLPGGELDPMYRPDGTHFSVEGSLRMTNRWLGAEVLRVYRKFGAVTQKRR
jgi:peptidoglycan/LPS O-acetylase OafA/YrhL